MKAKRLHQNGETMYALVFETGDDVVEGLADFADEQQLSAAHFTGIGAFEEAVLGFFDLERKDYDRTVVDEQLEVVSLVGDIALKDGKPQVHAHVVVAKRDGSAHGGHLLAGRVRPTLEVILTESPAHLHRESDDATGLALIRL